MSAIEALKVARAAGVQLGSDGHDLVLEASVPPPAAVLDLLSRHKARTAWAVRPAYQRPSSANAARHGRLLLTPVAAMGIVALANLPDDFGKNGGA